MKARLFCISFRVVVALLAAFAPVVAAPPAGYRLVFSEEFNGASLDGAKWNIESGTRRWALNSSRAVSLNGSNLVITTFTTNGAHFTGIVQSSGKFDPRYGYIEASINFDTAPGMWSAFWMFNGGVGSILGNPAQSGTEMDICEHRQVDGSGNLVEGGVVSNIHWDGYGADHQGIGTALYGSGLQSGFHTYAVEWTPDRQRYWLDGSVRWTVNYPVSTRPEYLILSSEVEGNSWAGNVPAGGYGNVDVSTTRLRVDWVRAYALPPTLAPLANRAAAMNTLLAPVRFTVDDVEVAPSAITVTAESSDPLLFPAGSLAVSAGASPWTSGDIGAVGKAGSTSISGGGITMAASGADIWGTADEGRFTHQALEGDGEIIVYVARQQNSDNAAKSGVMMRESTVAGSKYAFVFVTPGAGVSFEYRSATDAAAAGNFTAAGLAAPRWLRLVRRGNSFTGYHAADSGGAPGAWSQLGGARAIAMSNDVRAGLAVTAHNDAAYCNTLFTDVGGTVLTGGERTLSLAPAPDRSGTAVLSLIANDGLLTTTNTFTVTIAATNDPARLVSAAATWRYWDSNSAPPANWTATNFNDSAWPAGAAQLGFGDGDETTLVVSNRARVTTYFRHAFNVADPSLWTGLRLELLRDDGAVVYLNGAEVFRNNMPLGPVGAGTFATATALPEDETTMFYAANVSASLLRPGTNIVAVEVHQNGTNSSDLSFNFRLIGTNPAPVALVAAGSDWRYRDTGLAPPADWASVTYDDSAWPAGSAQLGYGDDDEFTVVRHGALATDKFITTWFRRAFTVSNPADIRHLTARLLRDDGAVVYLNGVEVWRSNVPTNGVITPATLASTTVNAADENTWFTASVNPALLLPGGNIVAVEVHQAATNSSDLSFDFELLAHTTDSLPRLEVSSTGNSLTFAWPGWGAAYALLTASNLVPPVAWTPTTNAAALSNNQWRVTLTVATNDARFYRLQTP